MQSVVTFKRPIKPLQPMTLLHYPIRTQDESWSKKREYSNCPALCFFSCNWLRKLLERPQNIGWTLATKSTKSIVKSKGLNVSILRKHQPNACMQGSLNATNAWGWSKSRSPAPGQLFPSYNEQRSQPSIFCQYASAHYHLTQNKRHTRQQVPQNN